MAHYADRATYSYGAAPDSSLICAGWLARGHSFRSASAPDGFLDRLAWRCVNQLERKYRGIHVCELCSPDEADYVSILHRGRKTVLGMAEITVRTKSGDYAPPSLNVHYVAAHGYLPPDDFVRAVLDVPETQALMDWSLFVGPYW